MDQKLNPKEWLLSLIRNKELPQDGSEELAKEWLSILSNQEELNALLSNKAFKQIQKNLERDFKARMATLVASDPELAAIKKMFIRTVGLKDAESKIEKQMVEYLQQSE